jgi:histidine triad (HIT) family protein
MATPTLVSGSMPHMTPDQPESSEASCPFCQIVRHEAPARIVFEDADVVAFFPKDPATLGHTLVIPRKHIRDVFGLSRKDALPLWEATLGVAQAIRQSLEPDGLNIINSAGDAASQTIFHVHLHVVPRWHGDAIGEIWPPKEPWSGEAKDDALDALQAACRQLR